ncbi:MAG: discoidin domain-containing protein [Candidatus Sumerlaeota bacterium]|nr:discoidin domain-containing protein [Candidatus Sumerlaeota bacterium]
MRRILLGITAAVLGLIISAHVSAQSQGQPNAIAIVMKQTAPAAEKIAARELAEVLQAIYPKEKFALREQAPENGRMILIGSISAEPNLREYLEGAELKEPESYIVTALKRDARDVAAVIGSDSRGAVYGVYALLEKLGCGFYLSYNALPQPRQEALSFDALRPSGKPVPNAPLVRDRLVFDWHNFLSGCSTWNLKDWQSWIAQSQKMGYNAVMVHAYGNNPMFSFEFNGKTKPVGWLSTTVKGRDWSTQHVNDVRRLWGGQVFDGPVFGPEAAMVPDDQRAASAQKLMREVFAYAGERAMDVYFALDVDTAPANPQEMIQSLPPEARFAIGGSAKGAKGADESKTWLADPDTPEGYRYYKAQAEALFKMYPKIDWLVIWFRAGSTPWLNFSIEDMPEKWRAEYQAEIAKTPEAAQYWKSHNMFALGKIIRAFERAAKELGRTEVKFATGTWGLNALKSVDRFLPPRIKFIPLDYAVLAGRPCMDSAEDRQKIREVAANRPVIPVVWAHHDDGAYIGRAFTPSSEFYTKLTDARASGYGIIHWMTRPLDLYFVSLSKQVWRATKDQPLRETCAEMAVRCFGPAAGAATGDYLNRWATEAPIFARETSSRFIDRTLTNIDQTTAGCRERLKLLSAADQTKMTEAQRDRLNYFKGLEEFLIAIHEAQDAYQRSQEAMKTGDVKAARMAMAECKPGEVIERFARYASLGEMTHGEKGLIVSMNLRWLPHLIAWRQALGMEATRYKFSPTSHDLLAQGRGSETFYFELERAVWRCLGAEETKGEVFVLPEGVKIARTAGTPKSYEEICRSGVESSKTMRLMMQPIMGTGAAQGLCAGKYKLRLVLLDPSSTAQGQRVFDIAIQSHTGGGPLIGDSMLKGKAPKALASTAGGGFERVEFEPIKAKYLRLACNGNSESEWNSILEVKLDALAKKDGQPLATASAATPGYPAEYAIDGNLKTRWAMLGRGHWIQFRLDPDKPVDHIEIAWFGSANRRAKYDVLISDDGEKWRRPKGLKDPEGQTVAAPSPALLLKDRMDIFKAAGGANRIMEKTYPLDISANAKLELTLTPVSGQALICGAVLEPINE